MEWKYPIVKKDGSEYTADELYEKLAQEDSGYYLLSTNQFWHGGVHFTSKNFAHCIRDFPVQAIAEGTVVAYRINKDYLFIEDEDVIAVPPEKGGYQYSSGFCLIKHNIEFTREITEEEKQQAIQEKVQQTTDKLKNQQITVQGSSRNYRNEEGIKPAKAGSYLEGTKLEIISIGDTPKDNLYFAKVREKGKTATTDEHYIALLDKDGNPLKNKDGRAFFKYLSPQTIPPLLIQKIGSLLKIMHNLQQLTPVNPLPLIWSFTVSICTFVHIKTTSLVQKTKYIPTLPLRQPVCRSGTSTEQNKTDRL